MYASKVKEMARQGARKIPPIQVPHKQLQALIDHAAPSLLPRAPSEVAVVQQLLAFAENDVVTPNKYVWTTAHRHHYALEKTSTNLNHHCPYCCYYCEHAL